jgi:hypothetical protein
MYFEFCTKCKDLLNITPPAEMTITWTAGNVANPKIISMGAAFFAYRDI